MQTPFTIIIPARYASTRLPGKPLLDINGKPLIQHVFETASKSAAKDIYIATDDERIVNTCESFGAKVILTSDTHESGTDRLAEAANKLNIHDDEIIVNVQGDEYGLPVTLIEQVANNLSYNPQMQIATLCELIESEEDYRNPNVVKVVFDSKNRAIYFSRSPIPATRTDSFPDIAYRHIGLYAYRAGYLQEFIQLEKCELEEIESLEQLRAIYNGGHIHVGIANQSLGIGIDTEEDLEKARSG